MKTVAVFGTFDGIHEGHRAFLREARRYGDQLVVIVARDRSVERLKGKTPERSEKERREGVEREGDVDRAVLGDKEEHSWKVLSEVKPEVIALGYDQSELRDALPSFAWNPEVVVMKPYQGDILHSRFLRKNESYDSFT